MRKMLLGGALIIGFISMAKICHAQDAIATENLVGGLISQLSAIEAENDEQELQIQSVLDAAIEFQDAYKSMVSDSDTDRLEVRKMMRALEDLHEEIKIFNLKQPQLNEAFGISTLYSEIEKAALERGKMIVDSLSQQQPKQN
jgi:hypothetical protein